MEAVSPTLRKNIILSVIIMRYFLIIIRFSLYENISRNNDLVSRNNEKISRNNDLFSRNNEKLSHYNDLISQFRLEIS